MSAATAVVADTGATGGVAAPAPGPRRAPRRLDYSSAPGWVGATVGVALLVGLWEVLALTVFSKVGSGVPTPTSVVTTFVSDWGSGLYGRNVVQTLTEAAEGYVAANVVAVVLAIAFVQVPLIEKALLRVAVATYCLPIIAVGPILTFVLHGDAPEAALAGLLVFFPSLVGVVVGLRGADPLSLDMVTACGGSSWTQLRKVRLWAALPNLVAALQIAAPAAILGAIVGEYLGARSNGLGIMLIDAEGALQVARTWGIALFATAASGLIYLAIGVLGARLTPWAPRRRPAGGWRAGTA